MPTVVSIDGALTPPEGAKVSVFDHGFLYGDSVYEVVRTYGGRPFTVREHLERLRHSAEAIGLELPRSPGGLAAAIDEAIAAGRNAESYVRIIVTRGAGPVRLSPAGVGPPRVVIICQPLETPSPETYRDGIALALVRVVRNAKESIDPNIKTGNYLNSVLALMEAERRGAQEAVMANHHGHLTECTTSNIFLARGGRLRTPALESGILSGITRRVVLDAAGAGGLPIEEGLYPADDLHRADEVFITSTTKGILPATRLDGKPVGDGRVGPLSRRAMELFEARVKDLLARG